MRTVVNRKGWSVQQSPPECKDCQSLTEKILVTTWNLKFIEWTQFHSLCAVPQFPCYKGTGGVQALRAFYFRNWKDSPHYFSRPPRLSTEIYRAKALANSKELKSLGKKMFR